MGDRRKFRTAAYECAVRALVAAAQGKGEAWFLAGTTSAGRTALLDEAIAKLPELPPRLVRIHDPRPAQLGLDGLVAQALGRQGAEAPSEDDLVAVFELLAGDHGANRALLVVDGAEQLSLQAVRYIQFACRSAPELQIIFAGAHAFRDLLADDEFAHLRRRLRPDILVPYLSDDDVSLAVQQTPAILGNVLPEAVETSAPEPAMAEVPASPVPAIAAPRRRSKRTAAVAALATVAAFAALATLPATRPWVLRVTASLPHQVLPRILPASAALPSPKTTSEDTVPAERIAPTLAGNAASEGSDPSPATELPAEPPAGSDLALNGAAAGGATQPAALPSQAPPDEAVIAATGSETAAPAAAPVLEEPSPVSHAAQAEDAGPAPAPTLQQASDASAPPLAASPAAATSPEQTPTAPTPDATPAQDLAAVPAPKGAAAEAISPALAAALLARGNAMLAMGDISAARLLFERAAAGGSVPAMEAAGRAYDPDVLARIGAVGIRADAGLAATYYRAAALNDASRPEPRPKPSGTLQAEAAH